MAINKVCCTCLSFDVQMFSLTDDNIRKCFEKVITKIEVEDESLQNVCAECLLLLRKFVQFKDKCLDANQRLREILSQSNHISEALLKAESRKLYSETIISFDDVAIIPVTNDSLLQVKQEVFQDESELNLERADNSESRIDINIQSFKGEHIQQHVETNQYSSDTLDDGISVNSEDIESEKVKDETKQTHEFEEYLKPVSKTSRKKKLRSAGKKITFAAKKRQALWNSEYAVQISLTEEQQKEELLKREMSESYLNASFKCSDCVTGFISQEKYEQHIELHNESRGALQCNICKLRYCNLLRLRLHQTSHRKRYKCLTCGTLTKTPKQATCHQNRHVGIRFECKLCEKKFKQEQLYRRHTRTAHPTNYVCDLCGDYFTSQVHLNQHSQTNKDCRKSPRNILECKMCDLPFLKLNCWYNHMLGHSKDKQENAPTDCQICGHKTITWNDWSYHIVYVHRNNKKDDTKKTVSEKPAMKYICDICGNGLSSKARLSLHIHTQHTYKNAVSPYYKFKWQDKCEICNKNILRTNMKRHMKTHTGEKPYKCDECAKCFTQAYTRDHHARNVHRIVDVPESQRRKWYFCKEPNEKSIQPKKRTKKFQCLLCPNKFPSKFSLEMHERSHRGEKPFSCDLCQCTYTSKYTLEIHKKIHTGEKPYACNLCDQKFHNKSYLRMHMINHTGEKRFACNNCDMRFKQKSNLTRHELVHTGAKNWTCDLCGKPFSTMGSLNLHIKTVHLHMPHPPRKPRTKKR